MEYQQLNNEHERSGVALERGDLLLKHSDGTGTSWFIRFGQKLFGKASSKASKFTHAAIATDADTVIESQGSGLEKHTLTGDNYKYKYTVFRLRDNEELKNSAAEKAELAYENHKSSGGQKHKYSHAGALASIFSKKDQEKTELLLNQKAADGFDGDGNVSLFCSGFVVAVYQAACEEHNNAEIGLGLSFKEYEPSALYDALDDSEHWERLGTNSKGGKQ